MFCPMPSSPPTNSTRRPWVPLIDPNALNLALARLGWTQRDLADECARLGTKVDRGNIGRAARGQKGGIGVRKLPVVARALGIKDPANLLTGRGKASEARKKARQTA